MKQRENIIKDNNAKMRFTFVKQTLEILYNLVVKFIVSKPMNNISDRRTSR
jgi:hypothetical protein